MGRVHANITSFYIKNLSIHSYEICGGILEPIPLRILMCYWAHVRHLRTWSKPPTCIQEQGPPGSWVCWWELDVVIWSRAIDGLGGHCLTGEIQGLGQIRDHPQTTLSCTCYTDGMIESVHTGLLKSPPAMRALFKYLFWSMKLCQPLHCLREVVAVPRMYSCLIHECLFPCKTMS